MLGGARKLWLTLATWTWLSVFIMGLAPWFFPTVAAAVGEDGNARPTPLLIKPVVEFPDNVGHGLVTNSEPTVRIVGFNGLCAEVMDGEYRNGNGVRLWRCRSDNEVRQLWRVMKDGTIRSNDWCMTTYGNTPGDYVMIYKCNLAKPDATIWQIWDNGTIVNPRYALALTGVGFGAFLTVEKNIYSPGQGWRVSNATTPRVASIVGFKGLCMEAHGAQVWVEKCSSDNTQKWTFYPDGSIRPDRHRDQCLTCEKDAPSTVITIDSCSSGMSGQRWVFTKEGSILNLRNGLVMDVRRSDPSLRQIILYPYYGTSNQKWSERV